MTPQRLMFCSVLLPLLGACAQPATESKAQAEPKPIGTPNPASAYCIKLGGRLEILKNADGGQYGMCHLPDGSSVEEWELFRRDHKQ